MGVNQQLLYNVTQNRPHFFIKEKYLILIGLNILVSSIGELPSQIQLRLNNLKISHKSNLMPWQQISLQSILVVHNDPFCYLNNPIQNLSLLMGLSPLTLILPLTKFTLFYRQLISTTSSTTLSLLLQLLLKSSTKGIPS